MIGWKELYLDGPKPTGSDLCSRDADSCSAGQRAISRSPKLEAIFETERPVSYTPNFLPFSAANGRLCFFRLLGGAFLGGQSDCRCQFSGLVAYLRPQNSAFGVALSAPPSVFTGGVVWFKPRHTFQVRVSRNLRLLVSLRSLFQDQCTETTL